MRLLAPLLLVAACRFEADYGPGVRCSDGVCPDGLVCNAAEVCFEPGAPDAATEPADAEPHALNCADPGPLERDTPQSGTTEGSANLLATMCDSGIYNGLDRVHVVALASGEDLRVTITGANDAYVLATCALPPSPCLGDAVAKEGFPLDLVDLAGDDYFIVVDQINPTGGASYTVEVHVGP